LPVVIEVTSTSTRTACVLPTVTSPDTVANRALIVGARKPARPENATTARPGSIAQVPAGGASVAVSSAAAISAPRSRRPDRPGCV
jgi:hypothetical protein